MRTCLLLVLIGGFTQSELVSDFSASPTDLGIDWLRLQEPGGDSGLEWDFELRSHNPTLATAKGPKSA